MVKKRFSWEDGPLKAYQVSPVVAQGHDRLPDAPELVGLLPVVHGGAGEVLEGRGRGRAALRGVRGLLF